MDAEETDILLLKKLTVSSVLAEAKELLNKIGAQKNKMNIEIKDDLELEARFTGPPVKGKDDEVSHLGINDEVFSDLLNTFKKLALEDENWSVAESSGVSHVRFVEDQTFHKVLKEAMSNLEISSGTRTEIQLRHIVTTIGGNSGRIDVNGKCEPATSESSYEYKIKFRGPQGNKLESSNYNIGIGVAVEGSFPMNNNTCTYQNSSRMRNRQSFLLSNNQKLVARVDLSKVEKFKGRTIAGTSNEVEVEFLDIQDHENIGDNIDVFAPILTEIAEKHILPVIQQSDHIYTKTVRTNVITEVNRLMTKKEDPRQESFADGRFTKPVDLSWDALKTGSKLLSQVEEQPYYTVTVKTDGVRRIVFWSSAGLVLIHPNADTINLVTREVSPELLGTMLDCELVSSTNDKGEKEYDIYAFDCLFFRAYDGNVNKLVDVRDWAHWSPDKGKRTTRHSRLKRVSKLWKKLKNAPLTIRVKNFLPIYDRDSFQINNKVALDMHKKRGIEDDGLIFTHTGSYNSRRFSDMKWKPLEKLTIDFKLLRKMGSQDFTLCVLKGSKNEIFQVRNEFGDLEAPKFSLVRDNISETIEEGQIIEFKWDEKEQMFEYVRPRFDRSQANRIGRALKTWNLIQKPISQELMTGVTTTSTLILMRKFTNSIKQEVMMKNRKRLGRDTPVRILDIGAGEGGTVGIWKAMNANVVAVEPERLYEKELRNRVRGANLTDQFILINAGGEEHEKIAKRLENEEKANIVTMFHSLTFFFESQDKLDGLLRTITENIERNGLFVCMAMDGQLINETMQTKNGEAKNVVTSNNGIYLERRGPRKINVMLNTPLMQSGQEEYLVDFDHMISFMESNGFELLEDFHMRPETVLDDAEIWWAKMTRIITMRYVGGRLKKSKDIDILKEKMANLAVLKTDTLSGLTFNNFDDWKTLAPAEDGGSSIIHSVAFAISEKYRTMDIFDKIVYVKNVRAALANGFSKKSLKTSPHLNVESYESHRTGLASYSYWFGFELLPYLANHIKYRIVVLWRTSKGVEMYTKTNNNNKTIYLMWRGLGNFQLMSRDGIYIF